MVVKYGDAGPNYLTGTAKGDSLYGLAGDDTLSGHGGGDLLNGGADYDTVTYWQESSDLVITLDVEYPGSGTAESADWTDTLLGFENVQAGSGDDTIYGTPYANELNGVSGDDTIYAGTGEDVIVGGRGDDGLAGGGLDGDVDCFVFGIYHGSDYIADFEDGVDLIQYVQGADSFDDLSIENRDDGYAEVTGPGNLGTVELYGMAGKLDESDFIFG